MVLRHCLEDEPCLVESKVPGALVFEHGLDFTNVEWKYGLNVHQMLWDLGKVSQLGDKPNFKEGRMLGTDLMGRYVMGRSWAFSKGGVREAMVKWCWA